MDLEFFGLSINFHSNDIFSINMDLSENLNTLLDDVESAKIDELNKKLMKYNIDTGNSKTIKQKHYYTYHHICKRS